MTAGQGGSGAPVLAPDARTALVRERLEAVRDLLSRHSAGGIVLSARRDFAWLTAGGQNHVLASAADGVAPIVVTGDAAVVLAPVNEYDRIMDEEISGLPLRIEAVPWWQPDAREGAVGALVQGRRLLEPVDVAAELESLRTVLSAAEHARLEWLAGAVIDAVARVAADVVDGTSEDEVAAGIVGRLAAVGARLPVILVAADGRIDRYRHPLSAGARIRQRVMVVAVAERWGLHVAHTQFVELDERPADVGRRAAGLSEVLAAMRSATVPGQTLGDVLAAARRAYEKTGLDDEWSRHHQGGTIGYQARERIATPGDPTPVRPGMAFAWNPSAVGFKREETLFLDARGSQHVLTTTPD